VHDSYFPFRYRRYFASEEGSIVDLYGVWQVHENESGSLYLSVHLPVNDCLRFYLQISQGKHVRTHKSRDNLTLFSCNLIISDSDST
jgi:hypothetical protein